MRPTYRAKSNVRSINFWLATILPARWIVRSRPGLPAATILTVPAATYAFLLFSCDMKTCTKCKREKTLQKFSTDRSRPGGLQCWCKLCCNRSNKDYHSRFPEKRKEDDRRRRYGVSPEEYCSMISFQKGLCAICGAEFSNRQKMLSSPHIDHCHDTGKVRGLLCHRCNSLLGLAEDSLVVLDNAKRYLNESRNRKKTPTLAD